MAVDFRGRDLRQLRVAAKPRVTQITMAGRLGIRRDLLSAIENEHTPFDDDFERRYRAVLSAAAA